MEQGPQIKTIQKVMIALGGNAPSQAGSPRETLQAALTAMGKIWGSIVISPVYQTPCFPSGSGPDFVNAACTFHSDQPPLAILAQLHDLEETFGRTRKLRWGVRTLDLDLIAVGDTILPDRATFDQWRYLPLKTQRTTAPDQIILPHPRLQDRPFVLVPLADIAPDWSHPVLEQTVTQMLAAHSDAARAEIKRL